jgi:deoxyguanosine kinase
MEVVWREKVNRPPHLSECPFNTYRMAGANIILVSLEGNIGSGKSTLLNKLKEAEPSWVFVDEPVDSWMSIKNQDGENLLEAFYKDKKRWSYTFQNAAVLTRGMMIKEAVEKASDTPTVIVMERCIETDHKVFATMLERDGMLNGIEWELYSRWYSFLNTMVPAMNAYIWVDVSPDVCAQRIMKRNRHGEEGIPLAYLNDLHDSHTQWLSHETSVCRSTDLEEIRKYIHSL